MVAKEGGLVGWLLLVVPSHGLISDAVSAASFERGKLPPRLGREMPDPGCGPRSPGSQRFQPASPYGVGLSAPRRQNRPV